MLTTIQSILDRSARFFDLPILEWIQAHLQCDLFDTLMPLITLFGEAGIFWIVCSIVLMLLPKHRKAGFSMGLALLFGVIFCNLLLKPWVARIRPYDYQLQYFGKEIALLVNGLHDYSFPSGHTIACFEACTALMLYDKKFGIPATVIAVLVSFSRLYLYVHYPTDVIVSVFLGITFGYLAYAIVSALWRLHKNSTGGKYCRAK